MMFLCFNVLRRWISLYNLSRSSGFCKKS